MNVLSVNGIDCIVLGCLGVAVGIVILHLIHVYKKVHVEIVLVLNNVVLFVRKRL